MVCIDESQVRSRTVAAVFEAGRAESGAYGGRGAGGHKKTFSSAIASKVKPGKSRNALECWRTEVGDP